MLRIASPTVQLEVEPAGGNAGCLRLRALDRGTPMSACELRVHGDGLEMTVVAGADGWTRLPACPGQLHLELPDPNGYLVRVALVVEE
jgi:hypothetical protein